MPISLMIALAMGAPSLVEADRPRRAAAAPARPRRSKGAAQPVRASGGGRVFTSCAQARAAGAAPVRSGDPGYSRRLDRDGDGVGCE